MFTPNHEQQNQKGNHEIWNRTHEIYYECALASFCSDKRLCAGKKCSNELNGTGVKEKELAAPLSSMIGSTCISSTRIHEIRNITTKPLSEPKVVLPSVFLKVCVDSFGLLVNMSLTIPHVQTKLIWVKSFFDQW